jgi:hypothetical protein
MINATVDGVGKLHLPPGTPGAGQYTNQPGRSAGFDLGIQDASDNLVSTDYTRRRLSEYRKRLSFLGVEPRGGDDFKQELLRKSDNQEDYYYYWGKRRDELFGAGAITDNLTHCEVKFYERMIIEWQQDISITPQSATKDNDFWWLDAAMYFELKSPRSEKNHSAPVHADYRSIRKKLKGNKANNITNFIIDIGEHVMCDIRFAEHLSRFNLSKRNIELGISIDRLWIADANGLTEIALQ